MVYIYILELENNKYYIGKSNIPDIRIENHLNSNGSEYTKVYKPLRLIEIINDCDDFDEDKYTLQYMDKYGVNNVRGGSFSEVQLSEENIRVITKMINGSKNQCFICGSKYHFLKDCDKKNELKVKFIDGKCDCAASFISSHRKSKCTLKKMFDSAEYILNMIVDDDDDTPFHDNEDNSNFKKEQKKEVKKITKSTNRSKCCYRCGREGHFASNCYAKYHISGKYIK